MIRRFTVTALAIGLASLTPSSLSAQPAAEPTAFDGSTVIDAISQDILFDVLSQLGAKPTVLSAEKSTFRVTFANGGTALLRLTACNADSCKGLLMLGYFTRPDGQSAKQGEAIARDFSLNYNPASVVINDKGEHIVKSYLIFDGGITKQNLGLRLGLFGDAVRRYGKLLYSEE